MNKKVIVTVVLLLVLGIGGVFAATKFKGSSTTTTPTESTQTPATANSLKSLLALGTSQTCTFDNQGNTGTMFISSGKVRGDFDSTVNGKTTKTHMIIDGKTSYIWMGSEKTGFKMSFDATTQPGASSSTQGSGTFDPNANMNFNCSAWVADETVFALPKGVTFTSFSLPITTPSSTGSGSTSSQCSYCESLTGDAKTQCKSSLNCN